MDEMTLLKDLGRDLEAQPPASLARQRNRLMEAARPSARTPRRRFLSLGVLTAATSVSLAAGTIAATHPAWLPGHGHHAKAPGRSPVNASYVLSLAADTVEVRPAVHPRPSQWAYTKEVHTPDMVELTPAGQSSPGKPETTEWWMRFDGTKQASLGDAVHSRLHVDIEEPDSDETSPFQDYKYLASLPTDPDALVERMCPHENTPVLKAQCVFTSAYKYVPNVAIPPRLQAAFYRALARLSYVVVRTDVVDLAGRHDIEIAEAYPGDFQSEAILLDPRTYEYRGQQLSYTQGGPLVSPNGATAPHDTDASARLAAGVVDRPGTRP